MVIMVQSLRNVLVCVLILLCVSASLRLNTPAQIRPIYDQGALGLAQLLKRLNTNASALMIGAHPDDEDTALLAYLARGENARTAYLSLTRGDGGQNILGTELGEALGVIRTEELLQARKLDGAEQFFTRAYDYGFSKTLAEAKEKWDEKIILCDVVRVIRSYQPLVVISQFTGTPSDGHGQHQYAGYISPLAVKAAADREQCKDAGSAWTVKKFYVRHRGQGEPALRINTGRYDPLLGRSYFEIAMHARSQHRSQEQGVLELKGDQYSNLTLVSSTNGQAIKETGIFHGIDIDGKAVLPSYDVSKPELLISSLAKLLPKRPLDYRVEDAILRATGTRIDVLADRETVVPGESFPVAVRLFTPSPAEIKVIGVQFNLPYTKTEEPVAGAQPAFRRESPTVASHYTLKVATAVGPTIPYWLTSPRNGDLFEIHAGRPFDDPAAYALVALEIAGERFTVKKPVQFRFADDILGEILREVNIVPKIAVEMDRNLVIASTQDARLRHEVTMTVTNNASDGTKGEASLGVTRGWTVEPASASFAMSRKGEKASLRFWVTRPRNASAGAYEVTAKAIVDGETFARSMQTISYEHIQTHRIYRPAKADVKLIDLKTAPIKVGYVRGSGDRVGDAIRELGLSIEEVDANTLATGDLSKFDTIVVGIRAYQVRPDVVANNQRLLDFAKNGGTLIVQYQLPATFPQQNLTPFPAQLGPRVADENAPVTILQPSHPIFNFPNKITQEDFKGWVQERNLYNFSMMDPKYVGLLESHDAGEAENKGGLVVADVGKGKYVYCSYSLFRQLPAGVPGAYRLLANMLSLPKATN